MQVIHWSTSVAREDGKILSRVGDYVQVEIGLSPDPTGSWTASFMLAPDAKHTVTLTLGKVHAWCRLSEHSEFLDEIDARVAHANAQELKLRKKYEDAIAAHAAQQRKLEADAEAFASKLRKK